MINRKRFKYPANCKKCKNADLTATGEQAYCREKGIFKKVLMWLLVMVGAIFDMLIMYASEIVGIEAPFAFLIESVVAIWLICNELISILENIKDCGVKLPPFLEPIIKATQEKVEEKAKVEDGQRK